MSRIVSKLALAAAAGVASVLAVQSANADTYRVTASLTTWTGLNNMQFTIGGQQYNTFAGEFIWSRSLDTTGVSNNWPSAPVGGESFPTFCVQLNQNIASPFTFTVAELKDAPIGKGAQAMQGDKALGIATLWANYYDDINSSGYTVTDLANGWSNWKPSTAEKAAAMQMAIWEIIYEDGTTYDMRTGNAQFNMSTAAADLSQYWLANWDPTTVTTLKALVSSTTQDQVFFTDSNAPSVPAPIPAAVWGGGILLGGLFTGNKVRAWRQDQA